MKTRLDNAGKIKIVEMFQDANVYDAIQLSRIVNVEWHDIAQFLDELNANGIIHVAGRWTDGQLRYQRRDGEGCWAILRYHSSDSEMHLHADRLNFADAVVKMNEAAGEEQEHLGETVVGVVSTYNTATLVCGSYPTNKPWLISYRVVRDE